MNKKTLSFAIAISLLVSLGVNALALENRTNGVAIITAQVTLDGTQLAQPALVKGGIVYLPLRSACETLGFLVEWTGTDNKEIVDTTSRSKTVVIDIVNQTITIDGIKSSMKTADSSTGCFLNDGHTYLNAELFSKAYSADAKYDAGAGTVTITSKPGQIDISTTIGSAFPISLKGNASTGYSWNYTIGDSSIIKNTGDSYASDSNSESIVGAGGTFSWTFKALKAGETTITFKYYRSWMGESSATAANTIVYKVTVK